jgi:hypothetical protein
MEALPWYRPLPVLQPVEWLIALDDLLCQRVRHCLLCGAYCTGESIQGIWDLSARRHVAYIMHDTCWRGGAATAAVRVLLGKRYGVVVGEGLAP